MSSSIKDYYAILGVEKGCSQEQVKRAFRKKARECHPDVNSDHDSEERFKKVNEAYEVLSDPRKREVYDRFGTADPRAGGFGGGGFGGGGFEGVPFEDIFGMGMDDVFSMFFGGVAGGGGRRGTARSEGRDMTTQVTVTLEEVATGTTKTVEYTRDAPCEECDGRGTVDGSVETCPDCGGGGRVRQVRNTFLGAMQTVTTCGRCGGAGQAVTDPCGACGGDGRTRRRETAEVEVQEGVRDGATVRVPGKGEAGLRGAGAGDLVVGVRVAPHEYLFRDKDDLHVQVRVSALTAMLGGTLEVEGLYEGTEALQVPAGTQHGDTVRIKKRGLPRTGRGGHGDLIVHLAVETPERLSRKEKKLLEELRDSVGEERVVERDPVRRWLGDR